MIKSKEYKISIPSSDDFIKDKKINDILYGWLQIHSYFLQNINKRVINANEVIFSLIESELHITRKTLSLDFKYLINRKYIYYDSKNNLYIIPDIINKFCQIGNTQLNHMIMSGYKNIVKVYCILKSYYDMNKEEGYFTQTILLDKIGYNNRTTSNHKIIYNITEWLIKNNYLDYETIGNLNKTKHKIIKIL